ncbi:hypothetical protein [Azospirillum sp. A39]|uniref:hypothetical protein n=1 Tax=Azospirillum sp. A39 TaxID=3462279 RepID=UPI004046718F
MSERHHLWAVANLLVGRYGTAAGERAEANAVEAERAGDGESKAFWADVAGALASRSAPPPGGPAG